MVQSFEAGVLRDLRARFGEDGPQLVQLVDEFQEGDRMVTPAGLREISTYAQAIAPHVERVLLTAHGRPVTGRSPLVEEAHRAALSVFCWTLRTENVFLPRHLRLGRAPEAQGDGLGEARQLLALGVDGLITDSPDLAVQAVRELQAAATPRASGVIPAPR
jgi:glycerophosphoryl diester phosphodiesterase